MTPQDKLRLYELDKKIATLIIERATETIKELDRQIELGKAEIEEIGIITPNDLMIQQPPKSFTNKTKRKVITPPKTKTKTKTKTKPKKKKLGGKPKK